MAIPEKRISEYVADFAASDRALYDHLSAYYQKHLRIGRYQHDWLRLIHWPANFPKLSATDVKLATLRIERRRLYSVLVTKCKRLSARKSAPRHLDPSALAALWINKYDNLKPTDWMTN